MDIIILAQINLKIQFNTLIADAIGRRTIRRVPVGRPVEDREAPREGVPRVVQGGTRRGIGREEGAGAG